MDCQPSKGDSILSDQRKKTGDWLIIRGWIVSHPRMTEYYSPNITKTGGWLKIQRWNVTLPRETQSYPPMATQTGGWLKSSSGMSPVQGRLNLIRLKLQKLGLAQNPEVDCHRYKRDSILSAKGNKNLGLAQNTKIHEPA